MLPAGGVSLELAGASGTDGVLAVLPILKDSLKKTNDKVGEEKG